MLPEEVRAVVTDPNALLCPDGLVLVESAGRFAAGDRREYVKLIRRQCRSGKVGLAFRCKHAASCFAVEKARTGRQREVWDGAGFSNASVRPPAPPLLKAQTTNPCGCRSETGLASSVVGEWSFVQIFWQAQCFGG